MIKRLFAWIENKLYDISMKRHYRKVKEYYDLLGEGSCNGCMDDGEFPCPYALACGPPDYELYRENW